MDGADERGTILVLFSDTGAGHRAAATALRAAIAQLAPAVKVELCDPLIAEASPALRRLVSLYPAVIRHSPATWGAIYHLSNVRPVFAALRPILHGRALQTVVARLRVTDADAVVSVHPLLNHLARTAIDRSGRPRGLITVVTDLVDVHRGWAGRGADEVVVATDQARRVVEAHGVPAGRVRQLGLPVDVRFHPASTEERRALRRRHGLEEDRPTVLVAGGGEGSGGLERLVEVLAGAAHPWQVVVVCGRNEALRQRLLQRRLATPTLVLGFVTFMPELLRAADLAVGKAGPGAIAEALATGVPLITTSYLPGQERHNPRFIAAAGGGEHAPEPGQLLEVVERLLLGDGAELRRMSECARTTIRAGATYDIARECLRVAREHRA